MNNATARVNADLKSSDCQLLKGNIAMVEAAINAGCQYFFGYPITPQNEVPAHFARRALDSDCGFIQSESEISAINMVYGGAAAGARVMTSSSSPGMSLKQEGISYIAAAQLPCVLVNMMRGGPGLGNIAVSQSDYFQAVKGGGHGDYNLIVLAPSTVQELADLTSQAFDLADIWSNPVLILGDAILAQVSEPVQLPKPTKKTIKHDFVLDGCKGRDSRIVRTLWLKPDDAVELNNIKLQKKYKQIKKDLNMWEEYLTDDAEIILTAYGSMARIVRRAINMAREKGIKVGMLRPITLWPFPKKAFQKFADSDKVKSFLTIEMSYGQMIEDVKLSIDCSKPVHFFGRAGGGIPTEEEILNEINKIK